MTPAREFFKFGKWSRSWRPHQGRCVHRESKERQDRNELLNFQPSFPRRFPMNFVEPHRALRQLRMMGRLPIGVLVVMLISAMAIADGPIASSSFVGAENPLSE